MWGGGGESCGDIVVLLRCPAVMVRTSQGSHRCLVRDVLQKHGHGLNSLLPTRAIHTVRLQDTYRSVCVY